MIGETICPKCGKQKQPFEIMCVNCTVKIKENNKRIFLSIQGNQETIKTPKDNTIKDENESAKFQ